MCTMSESVLGYDLWRSVNVALSKSHSRLYFAQFVLLKPNKPSRKFSNSGVFTVEEVCSRARDEGNRYKTVIMTMTFHEDQPSLLAYRDVYLEAGFVQKGRLSEVVQKGFLLLDRLYLQRTL